jgi:hypothetical protein
MPGYRITILILAVFLFRGCDSKVVVEHVQNKPNQTVPADGIIYALPNTVLRLGLKIDQATTSPPLYGRYWAIFVPEEDPYCKDGGTGPSDSCWAESKVAYTIQPGTTFATYGEPDPDQVFLVKFTKKGRIDQNLSMTWNEVGLMTAASAQVTNRTSDLILSGVKLVTGLGIHALALGAVEAKNVEKSPKNCGDGNETKADEWVIPILWAADRSEKDVSSKLVQNYCMIDKGKRASFGDNGNLPVKIKNPKTGALEDKKIFDINEKKIRTYTFKDLLTDAVNDFISKLVPLVEAQTKLLHNDGPNLNPSASLSIVQDEINKQMGILFSGTKKTLTWESTLDVRGLAEQSKAQENKPLPLPPTRFILGLDSKDGACLGSDAEVAPDSKPVPPKFKFSDKCGTPASSLKLELKYFPNETKQLFTKVRDDSSNADERSFRYRLPAQVEAVLSLETKSDAATTDVTRWASAVFSVAQLGTVISLPATHHSKTLSYELALIEATGGLKTFKLGTSGGLDAATIDALSGVGNSILDARNKNNDEIIRLTRQDQLLKLQDDICTIQKKYGLPCTVQPQ